MTEMRPEVYDVERETFDCEPTLTDSQVLEFCRTGMVRLEGVVPDHINRKTLEFLRKDNYFEPCGILKEDWFAENVVRNPEVTGAIRSLLGRNFGLPILMSQHSPTGPSGPGHWHRDGTTTTFPELPYVYIIHYPQDTPAEMGPTDVVPGSHVHDWSSNYMGHFASIRNAVPSAASAGSVFIFDYGVWHRQGKATVPGVRYMLKYTYWRTVPPQRDWIIDPDFDFATADYVAGEPGSPRRIDTARMFFWLCGKSDEFQWTGAQSWPSSRNRGPKYVPYGSPGAVI